MWELNYKYEEGFAAALHLGLKFVAANIAKLKSYGF